MLRRWLVHRLVFAIILVAGAAADLSAQTADELFANDVVHEIRLTMSSRDLQQLKARFEENTHFPADLEWKGLRVRNAAIRSRGAASRNGTKPGLQIQFDRYVTDQQFLGMGSLVLDNLWQDPSMIREHVAMAFFSRMGEPAPRESFCRLYINNTYQGLYGVVEDVTPAFLARTFTKSTGYLFEYKHVRQFFGEYLGDDLAAYKPFFEPRSHELDADTILYSPIRDMFREINQDDDSVWRERVDSYIDLEQLIKYVAVETFLAEPDGLLGFSGMNNFYLYRLPSTNRHRLIPWDKDLAFSGTSSPIVHEVEENELFRRAMAYEDLQAFYLKKLEQCAKSGTTRNWLLREVTGAAALVADAAHEDTLKPISNEEFDRAVASLKKFARRRSDMVMQQVETLRQSGFK